MPLRCETIAEAAIPEKGFWGELANTHYARVCSLIEVARGRAIIRIILTPQNPSRMISGRNFLVKANANMVTQR